MVRAALGFPQIGPFARLALSEPRGENRATRYLSWTYVAVALQVAFGYSATGRKHGLRLVYGSHLPEHLGSAVMFTVGHTIFIKPGVSATDPLLAHEYIHTLQYLGTSQIGIMTEYGLGELFSGTFGSGSVGNRLEAIGYLWQGWIETYDRPGILSRPQKPWMTWPL